MRIEKQGPRGGWSAIARTTTGADGRFAAEAAWKRAGLARAVSLRTPSPPVTVGLVPLLEVRADRDAIASGSQAVLRGTVRPSERVSVVIERRSGGRWKRVAVVVTPLAQRSFALRRRLVKPGTYRLTARVSHAGRVVSAPPVTVRVGSGGAPFSGGLASG